MSKVGQDLGLGNFLVDGRAEPPNDEVLFGRPAGKREDCGLGILDMSSVCSTRQGQVAECGLSGELLARGGAVGD